MKICFSLNIETGTCLKNELKCLKKEQINLTTQMCHLLYWKCDTVEPPIKGNPRDEKNFTITVRLKQFSRADGLIFIVKRRMKTQKADAISETALSNSFTNPELFNEKIVQNRCDESRQTP